LADNQESDALLDVLHIYSEELLDSVEDHNNGSQLSPIDDIECQKIGFNEQTSHLGSIEDLMSIDDRLYLKPTELITDLIGLDTNKSINNNNCPLSPISCNSESGYESVSSPSLSLTEQMIDSTDVCLDESFTELFPDLV